MSRFAAFIKRYRHVNWALADQAVVSGSNFVTGIVLARFLGPEAFGVYVLLLGVMLYANSFQGALIFNSMMSVAPQLEPTERAAYLRGVFALQIALTLTLVIAIGSAGAIFHFASDSAAARALQPTLLVALTFAAASFQLQDWFRRYCFLRQDSRAAFFNDLVCYGGQPLLLGLAGLTNSLNVIAAVAIVGTACAAAFALGYGRDPVWPAFGKARDVLREGWRAGRDYLAAWQFQWLGTQGVLVYGAGLAGAGAAGGVRAAQNIVGPVNIVFQAMENVLPVTAARRYAEGGVDGLATYLRRVARVGTFALAPFLVLVAIFAAPLTQLVYGERYVAFASLVVWGAASMFLQFYMRVVFYFLRTVLAAGAVLRTSIIMAGTSAALGAFTVPEYHATGVMLALLGGVCAGLIYSATAAYRIAAALRRGAIDGQPAHSASIGGL
jgi:O-antigen/teichoic acid export membrane protein